MYKAKGRHIFSKRLVHPPLLDYPLFFNFWGRSLLPVFPALLLRGRQRDHPLNLGLPQEGQDCKNCSLILGSREQSDGRGSGVFYPYVFLTLSTEPRLCT